MRIDSHGNVGIGRTAASTNRLDVNGNTNISGNLVVSQSITVLNRWLTRMIVRCRLRLRSVSVATSLENSRFSSGNPSGSGEANSAASSILLTSDGLRIP